MSTEPPSFIGETPASKKDEAIGSLGTKLAKESDKLLEERFVWAVILMIAFDAYIFRDIQSWSGPIVIGVMEFIAMIALGRICGVDYIWTLTEKIIDGFKKSKD